jgi:hypothetical protein
LTSTTRFWDDRREFNLYFVATLPEPDHGDRDTTLILKGLQVACRYRFLFLEAMSRFSAGSVLLTREEQLPELAASLLQELDLMTRQRQLASLDNRIIWAGFVDPELLASMRDNYRAGELVIRDLIGRVLDARDKRETLAALRRELSEAVGKIEDATRALNAELIKAMAEKLIALVKASGDKPREMAAVTSGR